MKGKALDKMSESDRKLQEQLLLSRRVEGDHLALADAVLLAALDGSRVLTAAERAALAASPLTARRLRQLALERRSANADQWRGSHGMLRAAAGAPRWKNWSPTTIAGPCISWKTTGTGK
jgi:hypothetical protein